MGTKRGKKKRSQTRTGQDPAAEELRAIIAAVAEARRRGDRAAREEAILALTEFRARPVSAELRQLAARARAAATTEDIDASLAQLKEIGDRMAAAAPALDSATAIATEGKKRLFFPRLAKAAEEMLESVRELKQAADELEAQLEGVDELGDLPMLLDSVLSQLDALKARAQALQG